MGHIPGPPSRPKLAARCCVVAGVNFGHLTLSAGVAGVNFEYLTLSYQNVKCHALTPDVLPGGYLRGVAPCASGIIYVPFGPSGPPEGRCCAGRRSRNMSGGRSPG